MQNWLNRDLQLMHYEWAFGERRGRTREIFKEMLWKGRVMWGMMVYDSIKAIDYIFTRMMWILTA